MAGQSSITANLFAKRMDLISTLSQANMEHLRILQRLGGYDILLMKEPESEKANTAKCAAQEDLVASEARIEHLESDVARIDEEIEMSVNSEQE